ncbi:porin [Undibacterium sp. TJN25]|uniref:porin n=1 Tax=Undibacterium sp. TJN25 TaxID=3413056 RepID=UPI003BF2BFC7
METIIKPYILVFTLGALACASSFAQTNVQIYGSVDEGVDYISNVRGEHQFAVNSGKRSPDRLGFRGTEDLGDGLSAFFKLETGLNSDTGAQANPTKFFNRYSTVGLSDRRLGTLTLGRMPDFAYDYVGPLNNSVPGISWSYSPGNLDNLANIFGIDNAIRYETPEFNGLQLGAMNGFGEDPTNFSLNRAYSLGARYNNNDLRLGASYSMFHNRTADLKATFGVLSVLGQNLTSSVFNTTRFSTVVLGGSYRLGVFIPHATWTQVSLENNRGEVQQRNLEAGVNIDISGGDKTRFFGVSGSHSTFMQMKYNQLNLFLSQYLSVSTQIYAGTAYVHASGAGAVAGAFGYQPSSGTSQILARTGVQVQF